MLSHDKKFRERINSCLEEKLYQNMYNLLCLGDQSVENIVVLRNELLLRVCQKSNDIVCKILIWVSELSRIEPLVRFLGQTHGCKKDSADMFYRAPDTRLHHPEKRQYDLATLYKVYMNVFCTKDTEMKAIYEANEPESMGELSEEVKKLFILIRFKGPFCCIADLGAHHVHTP